MPTTRPVPSTWRPDPAPWLLPHEEEQVLDAEEMATTEDLDDHEAAADPHTGYLKESEFDDIDFLVGTATGHTTAEIVVGTTPGGELGGTWASPTVDATHSGSAHAVAHDDLTELTDDDHTQYPLLVGRATGQVLTGGTAANDDLTLRPTTNATKGDIIVADQGGNVIIGGGTTASRLRILEASGSGTNYTEFVAQAQAGNITYTLPPDDGDASEVLSTDGSGNLTWVAGAAGGGHTIEEEGTSLTQRTKLNFVGTGVTVTDDAGDDASVVTIPGSAVTIVSAADEEDTGTTLQDHNELTVNLPASTACYFRFVLKILNDGAAEGIKVAVNGTAGVSALKAQVYIYDDTLNTLAGFGQTTAFDSAIGAGLSSGVNEVIIEGSILTTTAGTFLLRFAQNAAGAGAGVHIQPQSSMLISPSVTTSLSNAADAQFAVFAAHANLSAEVNIAAKQFVMYGADSDFSAERVVTTPTTLGNIPKVIRKTANETVNNSSALQNDDHLLYALAANEEVYFKAYLKYTSNTTPDFKVAFTVPTGATLDWMWNGRNTSITVENNFVTGSGVVGAVGGFTGTTLALDIEGIVLNGVNAGDLQMQWAQNTANATDSILYENSVLIIYQVAV